MFPFFHCLPKVDNVLEGIKSWDIVTQITQGGNTLAVDVYPI